MTCGCGCDEPVSRPLALSGTYPRTEAVLRSYAGGGPQGTGGHTKLHGYNPQQRGRALGGSFSLSDVADAASAIGKIVGTTKAITSSGGSSGSTGPTQADVDRVAAAILPSVQQQLNAKGLSLPPNVAFAATKASILDNLTSGSTPYLIGGGLLLLLLLLRR